MRAFAPYPVHLVPDYSPTAMFPHIYESFAFAKTVAFDKVYIGRRDARSLTNAAEVEALMKSFGYTPVYMEDYSIADQASIGAHAKHVVAIHGAAMAYLALSRRVETVIEIFPPHVFQSHFALALGARVGRYFVVVPDFDERVMLTGWQTFKNRPFAADLDLLRQALGEAGHRETG
jgi:capsular polysaccharide biosynthesis protein